ncbi:MAG: aminomethyl-transferring glycine dehydrogenase subunit GcvPA [Brevinematales bacterium]|nr:aminomethyl-transferring glycine dehydrogenase subunit GcvPA [Brevinematales bacterium]
MRNSYTPHTEQDVKSMLDTIGVGSIEELFSPIPRELRVKSFNLAPGLSEFDALNKMQSLSARNNTQDVQFMGGGFYDHFIPATADALASRGDFYTAYTPYQPEASQGTLQALYEYQTSVCNLFGMDVSNASLYDGGTALAEAVLMAFRATRNRDTVLIDANVNPLYRDIVKSYLSPLGFKIKEIASNDYQLNRKELISAIDEQVASVVLQNPNFFGTVDDYTDIADASHSKGALMILSAYPLSLGLLKSPGEMNADIATAEGQSLGLPLSFGGPYLGILTANEKYIRSMPGRIVGRTVDKDGNDAFVLTLQPREQHIRREKATSNICSNQGLCALRALIYMSLIGRGGLKELSKTIYDKTQYAKKALAGIKSLKIPETPCFNEFVIELPGDAGQFRDALSKKGISAGIPLGTFYPAMKNRLLVAVTEKRTREEIDALAAAIREAVL